jgi:CHAD domain-containing protein
MKEGIDARDTRTIHCTRVAFKKFRYMMETLGEFVPSLNPKRLREMHDYQTLMGDVQDAQVLLQAFDKYRGKKEVEAGRARTLLQALLRRRQQLIHKFLSSADRLENFWPDRGGRAATASTRTRLKKGNAARKGTTLAAN